MLCDIENERYDNEFLKSKFGADVPTIAALKKRVVLLLVNSHPIFDQNRPVTPATVYLGALHLQPKKELPQVDIAKFNYIANLKIFFGYSYKIKRFV